MSGFPKTVKEHWDCIGLMRCVITNSPYATIHHVHGGSMKDAGYVSGAAQRGISDALVIPLKAEYHVLEYGIDSGVGVETWELYFGTQMDFLEEVNQQLPYDIWELHEAWKIKAPPRGR